MHFFFLKDVYSVCLENDSKNNFIRVPYNSTVHGQEEINAVIEVLKTSTQMSKNVELFENKIAKIFGHEYGIMVNSGSSALFC